MFIAIPFIIPTHIDSEDDYCIGCRNVSHCQQQQLLTAI